MVLLAWRAARIVSLDHWPELAPTSTVYLLPGFEAPSTPEYPALQ